MKKTLIIIGSVALAAVILFFSVFSFSRIDAGHVGLVVKLYGSNKGVQDVTEVTGIVWYNQFSTEVYEFPTYVQNVVFTRDKHEGSDINEEFRVTTKDGLVVSFDVSLNYRIKKEMVASIFKKYRKPLKELDKTIIRNYMRDAYNQVSGVYTAEQLYENKVTFQNDTEEIIRKILAKDGFVIEQVVLLNELRLPKAVVNNINAKINARQIALKKQQEVAQEKADALKQIEKAKGYAESIRIKTEAQAKANIELAQSITPALIQYEKVKKWDGKNPEYVGSANSASVLISK